MSNSKKNSLSAYSPYISGILFIIAIIIFFTSASTSKENSELEDKIKSQESQIKELTDRLSQYEDNVNILESEKDQLGLMLNEEQQRVEEFEEKLDDYEDELGDLELLAETDPELLQKYSKVFFLNEHYSPPELHDIPDEYTFGDREVQVREEVWRFLELLLEDADEEGLNLQILSGFRSFDTQTSLKERYTVTYGAGTANQFSADQGYSEHQLGTTVDFTTLSGSLSGFDNTAEFKWLEDNAHNYGFILSYPKDNIYYQYEPWHWRFVGRDLARTLNRRGEGFYDTDQRELDQFLIYIFD